MSKSIHDSGYKKLFSNKVIFKQLIETFVKEPWVKDLDFSEFETLDKSFLSEHYKKTESDLICKLKLRNQDFYIFVLLEFQSTVDKFMAVRMLNYITNFYMDLIASKPKPKKLPPVFPVMLYNGDRKWTSTAKFSDLIEGNELLGNFSVKFEYLKILENEYSLKELLRIRNIVSTLFLAETHYDLDLLQTELSLLFKSEDDKVAVSLFLNWFKQLYNYGKITEKDFDKLEQVYKNSEKAKSMLITAIKKEKQKYFEEGIQKGEETKELQIARKMLQLGISIEKVNLSTSLPIEKILELQQEIRKN